MRIHTKTQHKNTHTHAHVSIPLLHTSAREPVELLEEASGDAECARARDRLHSRETLVTHNRVGVAKGEPGGWW